LFSKSDNAIGLVVSNVPFLSASVFKQTGLAAVNSYPGKHSVLIKELSISVSATTDDSNFPELVFFHSLNFQNITWYHVTGHSFISR
jgi:hypothetical protein